MGIRLAYTRPTTGTTSWSRRLYWRLSTNPFPASTLGKLARPTKKSVVVDEKLDSDTPLLIAHFQGTIMNRPKPQGFINRATAGGEALEKSTIYQLNLRARTIMAIVGNYYAGKDTVDVLVGWHSSLKSRLTK